MYVIIRSCNDIFRLFHIPQLHPTYKYMFFHKNTYIENDSMYEKLYFMRNLICVE